MILRLFQCLALALPLSAQSVNPQELLNTRLTAAAWNAYLHNSFEAAVKATDECIKRFKDTADAEQRELAAQKAPLPPIGRVPAQVAETILRRGALNDVATCFIIRGWALRQLKRADQAHLSFQEAARYTYARCWDPRGWFWSPAIEAEQENS